MINKYVLTVRTYIYMEITFMKDQSQSVVKASFDKKKIHPWSLIQLNIIAFMICYLSWINKISQKIYHHFYNIQFLYTTLSYSHEYFVFSNWMYKYHCNFSLSFQKWIKISHSWPIKRSDGRVNKYERTYIIILAWLSTL